MSKPKIIQDIENVDNKISLLSGDIGDLSLLNQGLDKTNLVSAINSAYTNQKITLSDVKTLTGQSIEEGTKARLNWTNPTSNDLLGVEVFVSTTDTANMDYAYCNTNLTRIANSNISTVDYVTQKNTLYYFKVFAKYDVFGEVQYSKGVNVSVLTEDKTPPNPITNFTVTKEDNMSISLSWTNPINTDFSKVKIVYKTGSYPTSVIDGTLGYEGALTSATITGLTNDTLYYFRAFTYDISNNENNTTTGMQITATPSDVKIYGVKIDKNNSNPLTAATYTDNAVGMTGGAASWDSVYPFNQIRPVMFKNGVVNYELSKSDFTKKVDGVTASDITSGTDGDVMIEFPKIWWKFETIGTDLYVKYADKQVDSTWKCWGHTKGATEKDKVYIGAYLGYNLSGKLRSLSGKTPTVSQTIGTFRTQAQANGAGYEQMGYFQLLMLQVLYLIRYKSLDSQTALGRGYADGNTASITTGGTNSKGMNFGETTGKQQMKFMGIEDFWGNCYYWIDGLFSDSSRNILIGTQNFNDTGSGYTNYGQGSTVDIGGYINDVQGGSETGFIIKGTSGSATTYYSDYGYLYASRVAFFGGYWGVASSAGAFFLRVDSSAAGASSFIAARLAWL